MLTRNMIRTNGVGPAVDPLDLMGREMDRLFESLVGAPGRRSGLRPAFPALNAWEADGAYVVEAELPGFGLEDLDVSVDGRTLTVKGAREAVRPEDGTALRVERASGSFERTVELPAEIDADQVEASLSRGVLTVRLPIAESARPRKIEVRAASGGASGSGSGSGSGE